jgi:hypothetical protein
MCEPCRVLMEPLTALAVLGKTPLVPWACSRSQGRLSLRASAGACRPLPMRAYALFSLNEMFFLRVRVLPDGSLTLAVSRSDSFPSRLSRFLRLFDSFTVRLFLALAPTRKALETEARLLVRADRIPATESFPETRKLFRLRMTTLTGALAEIRRAETRIVTSVLAPKARFPAPGFEEPPAGADTACAALVWEVPPAGLEAVTVQRWSPPAEAV